MKEKTIAAKRSFILIFGVFSMLFAGIIYAWSILKGPLSQELGFDGSELALNFTLTMCGFCLGGFFGSILSRKIGTRASILLSAFMAGGGFVLTGLIAVKSAILLYLTYALMAGGGIGIAYNVIISSVNAWFPDKAGFCSGCLMMGFGASTLVLGNLANTLFSVEKIGWRGTYLIVGVLLCLVLSVSGFVIRRPRENDALPSPTAKRRTKEDFEAKDYSPRQMLARSSFWRGFALLVFLTAVGSSVISFAKDLSLSVGAKEGLATTLVGVLSVFNGVGRIATGKIYDVIGRRRTMLIANIVTILASGITLIAIYLTSLPLCVVGLCLTGLSYGSSPTLSSAFASSFYGKKHFSTNFSIMNFNLMLASFVATICSEMLSVTNGYLAPFILLLGLSSAALVLNLTIKKP